MVNIYHSCKFTDGFQSINLFNFFLETANSSAWLPTLLLWFINIVIFGGCLVKLLVYGDPVIDSQAEETRIFWKHKKQSDYYIEKVCLYIRIQLKMSIIRSRMCF